MRLGFLFCVCAALLVGGCDRSTPEERREVFNEKWGPEVTFKDEHLLVNWPDVEGVTPPRGALSLKIPRAYLDSHFGEQDDKGKVDRIYLELMLPDGSPKPQLKRSWNPSEKEKAQFKDVANRRVFVVLYRNRLMQEMASMHREKYSVGGAGKYAFRDGEVDGLEKWSAAVCMADHLTSPPDYKAMVQNNLDNKAADDRSPVGCYKDVRNFVLITPETETHKNLVTADCWNQTCRVNFNVANRTAELTIGLSDAHLWRQRVEVARRVISNFVVSSNP